MTGVSWAAAATRDLVRVEAYLSQFGEWAAQAEVRRLVLATDWLVGHPLAGPVVGYRDWRKWKPRGSRHLLIYRPLLTGIQIVRLRHERENWLADF